ncbi:MAG: hypothetical protein MZV64_32300 [Ignavibacteriales bacterium]|nr:hypothetical protein [Ignavibacteriales bacterium]
MLVISPFTIEIGPQPGWTAQTTPITSSILCVDVVDTVFAWAGTIDGKTLRTTNGGQTWATTYSALGGEVTSISAINNSEDVLSL